MRLIGWLQERWYAARCFLQRGRRGWSDGDWWEGYSYIGRVMAGMLTDLRDKGHGYWCPDMPFPSVFSQGVACGDDDADNECRRWWRETLTTMIEGFERMANAEDLLGDAWVNPETDPQIVEALRLLALHWPALWD